MKCFVRSQCWEVTYEPSECKRSFGHDRQVDREVEAKEEAREVGRKEPASSEVMHIP